MSRERTFLMVKPDGVHRGHIGEIISRFERRGYKLIAMKIMLPNTQILERHYGEHEGKPFFNKLVKYMSSGPVVPMVWEGTDVVKTAREMIGATNPLESKPGTIRGDFCIDKGRNFIHGSDSVASAQKEISIWFQESELAAYSNVKESWIFEN